MNENVTGEFVNVSSNSILSPYRNESSFSQVGSAILGSCTVIGNTIALTVILTQQDRITKAYTLMANLALSDCLNGCTMLAFSGILADKSIVQNDILCSVIYALMVFTTSASTNALLIITIDRYLIIVWPLRYFTLTSFPRSELVVAFGWIIALLGASLPVLNIFGRLHLTDICSFGGIFSPGYIALVFSLTYAIPLIAMLLMYLKIGLIAKKHRRQILSLQVTTTSSIQESNGSTSTNETVQTSFEQKTRLKEQWKATKTIFIVLGYFIVSWLPFYFCMMLAPFINRYQW